MMTDEALVAGGALLLKEQALGAGFDRPHKQVDPPALLQ